MASNHDIVQDLLDIKAVQIKTDGYFTWTSGIQSPIYCDNRLTMSYPAIRKKIAKAFAAKVRALDVQPDVIAGCATAGITHAAWLADELDLPMVYVRSKPKAHGKGNQIEGFVKAGQKAIVIEDLISTGGSSIESAQALQAEGVEVLEVMAIFTYGLAKAEQQFADAGLTFSTISGFDALVDLLEQKQEISAAEKAALLEWRNER